LKNYTRTFQRLASLSAFTLIFISRPHALAAQPVGPTGPYGFLIHSTFTGLTQGPTFPTGVAILGVTTFDGAGNVAGSYTYEIDTNSSQVPHTTRGTLAGTYTTNPDGSGNMIVTLDLGVTLTMNTVLAEGGNSLRLLATNFTFPSPNCGCSIAGMLLTGIARAKPAASLSGSFAAEYTILPNASATVGTATFDGAGNVTVSATFMGSADSNGVPPAASPYTQAGTYTVNPDGTGAINLPAGQFNAQTWIFVTTDNGSGILWMQTDRPGSGVAFGICHMQ
jgi:hypothetical protein